MNCHLFERIFLAAMLVASLVSSGCVTASRADLDTFERMMETGNYSGAASFAETEYNKVNKGKHKERAGLLWALQSGVANRAAGDFVSSNTSFDAAESILKVHDLLRAGQKAGRATGATLTSDAFTTYSGWESDGIMVNTYKALNDMALGSWDAARVELNRTLERQQRAVEYFEKMIAEQKKELNEEKDKGGESSQATLDDPKTNEIVQNNFAYIDQWEVYGDFVNP